MSVSEPYKHLYTIVCHPIFIGLGAWQCEHTTNDVAYVLTSPVNADTMGLFETYEVDSTSVRMLLLSSLLPSGLLHAGHNQKGHSFQGQLQLGQLFEGHNSADLHFSVSPLED